MAEARITSYDGNFVEFFFEDHSTNKTETVKLTVEDFIATLIVHIPDKHFRQIRYAGIFANRVRTKIIALAKTFLPTTKINYSTKKLSWRERRFNESGIDPLICPCCNKALLLSSIAYNSKGHFKEIFFHPP